MNADANDPAGRITVAAAMAGHMTVADIRLTPDVLRAQASTAAANGNAQMAASLERAAEMCSLADDDIMALYEALRPHRSTAAELEAWVSRLREAGAVACADFVADARTAYARRDLLRLSGAATATDSL